MRYNNTAKKKPTAAGPLEDIEGTFLKYRFQGDKGWSVGVLKHGAEEVTITGGLHCKPMDFCKLSGRWENNARFGLQFKVESCETKQATGQVGITGYLERLPGIGPTRAEQIYERFGNETFNVIENNPKRLAEIPGITDLMVIHIAAAYLSEINDREQIVYLKQFGLTDLKIAKIMMTYGHDLANVLKTDPYRMIEDIDGFGFSTVDAIAVASGLDRNAVGRVRAGILFILQEAAGNGSTCLPSETLWMDACRLLTVPAALVKECVADLIKANTLTLCESKVALTKLYLSELNIAECVMARTAQGKLGLEVQG